MKNQSQNYYISRESKLLKSFDKTARLVKGSVISRYGEDFADMLYQETRREYEQLIPQVPYIEGARASALNSFLCITAQEVAVYKAMKRQGKTAAEAWEICHEALRASLAAMSPIKRWFLSRLMFSSFVKKRMQQRAARRDQERLGEFEVEYVMGDGNDFDFGVDYVACGNYNFVKEQGAAEFAPYVCMSDIALGDAMNWGLIRTETLADGCERCDFRFKQGGSTRISSKTPEVQATIEKIREKEAV
jgi:hypothetical protein